MKIIKFIPALAMVALLSACGTKSNLFKAPKFDKQGASVEKDVLVSEIDAAYNASVYLSEDELAKSFVSNTSYGDESISTVYKGGKKYSETIEQHTFKMDLKADAKNYVTKMDVEEVDLVKNKQSNIGSYEMKEVMKDEAYLQSFLFDGQEVLGQIIKSERMFMPLFPITEENPLDKMFDKQMKSFVKNQSAFSAANYLTGEVNDLDEAKLQKVSLFKNNNTYTYVYEETLDPAENKDADDNLVSKVEEKKYEKMQVTIKGNNCKFVAYALNEKTTTYYANYTFNGILLDSGDYIVKKETSFETASVQEKNVTVKAESIDGYLLGSMI